MGDTEEGSQPEKTLNRNPNAYSSTKKSLSLIDPAVRNDIEDHTSVSPVEDLL
jgi:hypothetical protein